VLHARLVAAALSIGVILQQPRPADLCIRRVTIVDADSDALPAAADVVIDRGRIRSIEPQSTAAPALHEIDGAGQYLIAGLIDAHVHLTVPFYPDRIEEELTGALRDGVTSIREMGGDLPSFQRYTARAPDGATSTPRIFFSALIAGAEWFASQHFPPQFGAGFRPWLTTVDAARIAPIVEAARRIGATGIKITSNVGPSDVGALARQAHAAGLRVWTHAAVHPGRPMDAVRAGADVLSHSPLLAWQTARVAWPGHDDLAAWTQACASTLRDPHSLDELFAGMRETGAALEPTLSIYHQIYSPVKARPDPMDMCATELARRAHAAGVRIIAGTDYVLSRGGHAFLQDELQRLVSAAGLTPRDALAAATINAARGLGQQARLGRVAVGFDADLVLLAQNPLQDIQYTRLIVTVIRAGKIVGAR
jgi:imidazolonepropionase-like amidohydrolase